MTDVRKPFSFWPMGCMLGLAMLVSGCAKNKCDDPTLILDQPVGETTQNFPETTDITRLAQGFKLSDRFDVASMSVLIQKGGGSPAGTLRISIHKDDGTGEPEDSSVSNGKSGFVDVSGVSGSSLETVPFAFPDEPELSSDTQYYFVIESSGGLSTADYLQFAVSNDDPYPDGELLQFDDDADDWVPTANKDLEFLIEGCKPD